MNFKFCNWDGVKEFSVCEWVLGWKELFSLNVKARYFGMKSIVECSQVLKNFLKAWFTFKAFSVLTKEIFKISTKHSLEIKTSCKIIYNCEVYECDGDCE